MKRLLLAIAVVCFVMACEKPSNEKPGPGPDDGTDTTEVTVPTTPKLTLTSEPTVSMGAEGGIVTITYTLENPVDGGEISASAEESVNWISDFNSETEGSVSCSVSSNDGDARQALVTVCYTYGEGETESFTVTVAQEADTGEEYALDANFAYGSYYGDDLSDASGEMVYQIHFSDVAESSERTPGVTYYVVSVVSGEPSNMGAIAPADGTYALAADAGTVPGYIWNNADYSYAYTVGTDGGEDIHEFASGEISFVREGNIVVVEGHFVDVDGGVHVLTYSGGILLDDASMPDFPEDALSTLTGDVVDFNAGWTNTVADGYFFGSMNEEGVKEYTMSIKDGSYTDYRTLMITVYMPLSNTVNDGILDGTYPISSTVAENTVRAGYVNEGSTSLQASWYYDRTYSYPDTQAGPLYDGNVAFERNDDGTYNVYVDAFDDAGNVIKATFSDISYSVFDMESWM